MRHGISVSVCFWLIGSAASAADNVILFIGDGFGASQMALGIQYGRLVESRTLAVEELMRDGNTGYSLPLPHRAAVTDSAAAASQMATGQKARNESFGLSADGHPVETILEWAHARGLKTGLVSNMRLSHATVASFAAHQSWRYNPEARILDDVLLDDDVDVLLGGGARALVPEGRLVSDFLPGIAPEADGRSNRDDGRNRIAEAEERGYTVVSDRESLAAQASEATRLLGLFAASHMPYVLDRRAMEIESMPSLRDLTSAALKVLSRSESGFFLMVEGGRIDYAGHANDAGSMLHEILDFDEAVALGIEFQRRRPDTLLIVTADHGTGGFSFTYGDFDEPRDKRELPSGIEYGTEHTYPGREHLLMLRNQTATYGFMLDKAGNDPRALIEVVQRHTGSRLTLEEARDALERDAEGSARTRDFRHFYGDPDDNRWALLARALARQSFVVWATGGHTSEPVLTFGRGPGAEKLRGVYENTHLFGVMKAVLGNQ